MAGAVTDCMITDQEAAEEWLREVAAKQGQAPSELRLIRLKRGEYTLVDSQDYPHIAARRWSASAGYAVSGVAENGRTRRLMMHREVMQPSSEVRLDHKDRNRFNNTRANLRPATKSQNAANAKKRADGVFSVYRGVNPAVNGKPMASIWVSGKPEYLGIFDTQEQAARAYDAAARHYWGEFANPNFLDAAFTYEELKARREADRLASKQCPYRGVMRDTRGPGFRAAIRNGGPPIYLGYFPTAEAAALAYDEAARRLKGERAKVNFSCPLTPSSS